MRDSGVHAPFSGRRVPSVIMEQTMKHIMQRLIAPGTMLALGVAVALIGHAAG